MKHLLIIGLVLPEPNSTAAGKRMLQLIKFFKNENYTISFLSAANNLEYSASLDEWEVRYQKIELNDASFEGVLAQLNPDVVLFDRFVTEEQFGWKVAEICPNAMRILDTEDLHFLRKSRENAFKKGKNPDAELELSDVFKREMASIFRCDLSLIISEYEMYLLQDKFNVSPTILFYLPLFATVTTSEIPEFSRRSNFVSIGNFLHEPNWQTVLKLKQLWPEIKKRIPKAEMHIYGAYCTDKAMQLNNAAQGFLVKGRANSVEDVFHSSKILLAPIPFGAGIKGKLLDAMRLGLPSVTTYWGAEGMNGDLPWNGEICTHNDDFISSAVQLYLDEERWIQAQKNGFELVKKRFDENIFIPLFRLKIQEIYRNLNAHRQKNFLGQILQHHSLQSTKYLGKWIEEKNKKIGA